MLSKWLYKGMKTNIWKNNAKCELCIISEINETPFLKSAEDRSTRRLQLVHSEGCGTINTSMKIYFVTYISDYSIFCIIYLMTNRIEAFEKLKEYVSRFKDKFRKMRIIIQSDNLDEYIGHAIK